MDMGIVRGVITALVMILFLGIWAWSWSRKRKADFDAASRLPLHDGDTPPADKKREEHE